MIETPIRRGSSIELADSFNRDSQDIPESRRKPILAGMSGEERVSAA
jgi:hypothetical protein